MSNDVSFKRADYIEALSRWSTVRDVCAGQHRVVDRLPYINAHDTSLENKDRNKAYRERAVFKNATGHTRNGLLGLAFHKDPTLAVAKKLEYLQDNANGSGVSIYQHSQGTLEKVLEAGRHGLYVDYHQDARRRSFCDPFVLRRGHHQLAYRDGEWAQRADPGSAARVAGKSPTAHREAETAKAHRG